MENTLQLVQKTNKNTTRNITIDFEFYRHMNDHYALTTLHTYITKNLKNEIDATKLN